MLFRLPTVILGTTLAELIQAHDIPRPIAPELKGRRSMIERNGVKRTIFEHEATGATIDFVTNSGICETTPGVNQYSGYLNVGSKFIRSRIWGYVV